MDTSTVSFDESQIHGIKKKLEKILFDRQEMGLLHNSSHWDAEIYQAVSTGNLDLLKEISAKGIFISGTPGMLAHDELRNIKNLAISVIVSIMSYLVRDMYLNEESAYSISDASILALEDCTNPISVVNTVAASMFVFTEKVAQTNKSYHPLVKDAKNYIQKHLHEKIRTVDIARTLGTSSSYLAQAFKNSEGMTIHDFVRREKLERARNLIRYSELNMQSISDYLGYATPSHFSREFKAASGETPSEFRLRVREFSREKL